MNFVPRLTINVHKELPPTVEPESNEWGWGELTNSYDLDFWVLVLELRKVPENKVLGSLVIGLPAVVVEGEDADVGLQN
jgi:hypothetical protein